MNLTRKKGSMNKAFNHLRDLHSHSTILTRYSIQALIGINPVQLQGWIRHRGTCLTSTNKVPRIYRFHKIWLIKATILISVAAMSGMIPMKVKSTREAIWIIILSKAWTIFNQLIAIKTHHSFTPRHQMIWITSTSRCKLILYGAAFSNQ